MKEIDIQAAIITYLGILESQGKIWFSRLNNIPPVNKGADGKMVFRKLPRGCKKGIPDILIISKGLRVELLLWKLKHLQESKVKNKN
ncbi:VRR-NUC domain-containing protein [Cetobacterium somerae]|uniref:VRR-NUC domain-containing protein n=1 Tax=Cetobacterium somerae TaxID=188913 RepID=UPI00211E4EFB|nr:VRR-NUC domain-containing protein [Cetobacterium somerae]